MAAFLTCHFEEIQGEVGSTRSFASAVAGQRFAVPGANRVLVHRNVAATHLLEAEALCSLAEVEALQDAVGSVGTLTLAHTAGVAYLLSVVPRRVFAGDCYVATLSFRYGGSLSAPGFGGWGFTPWGQSWGS
jgi:hypothetical protein